MTRRLQGRPERPLDSVTEAVEEIEYQSMPSKRSFPMRVSLRMMGRGRPLPLVTGQDVPRAARVPHSDDT